MRKCFSISAAPVTNWSIFKLGGSEFNVRELAHSASQPFNYDTAILFDAVRKFGFTHSKLFMTAYSIAPTLVLSLLS